MMSVRIHHVQGRLFNTHDFLETAWYKTVASEPIGAFGF
jgi:hypothetical protein